MSRCEIQIQSQSIFLFGLDKRKVVGYRVNDLNNRDNRLVDIVENKYDKKTDGKLHLEEDHLLELGNSKAKRKVIIYNVDVYQLHLVDQALVPNSTDTGYDFDWLDIGNQHPRLKLDEMSRSSGRNRMRPCPPACGHWRQANLTLATGGGGAGALKVISSFNQN